MGNVYQWFLKRGGITTQVSSDPIGYTLNGATSGDQIWCELTTNCPCRSGSTAISKVINIVASSIVKSISITLFNFIKINFLCRLKIRKQLQQIFQMRQSAPHLKMVHLFSGGKFQSVKLRWAMFDHASCKTLYAVIACAETKEIDQILIDCGEVAVPPNLDFYEIPMRFTGRG